MNRYGVDEGGIAMRIARSVLVVLCAVLVLVPAAASAGSGALKERPLEIEVTGGSTIEGDVVVERNIDVRLILRDGGRVLGRVDGAEVIEN